MDLVADGVQLGSDAVLPELPGQRRHLEGLPEGRELARVDELQGITRRASGRRDLELRRGHDRREDHAPAAGLRHRGLEEGPKLLGLTEHVARGGGDLRQAILRLRVQGDDRLGNIREIRPQPPVVGTVRHHLIDLLEAPQKDDVETLLLVELAHDRRRLLIAEPIAGESG